MDLYMRFPASWLPSTVVLYAELDGVRVEVDRRLLSESDYTIDPSTGDAVALVFSVRGHPVTAWDVMIDPLPGAAGEGRFRMMCWGQDCCGNVPELAARRYDSGPVLLNRGIVEPLPTQLWMIAAYNDSRDAPLYLQLFDAIAFPPNGTPPDWPALRVGTGRDRSLSFHRPGHRFEAGLVWCASTTGAVLTLAGTVFKVGADYLTP
jgi:hypothetical protein